MESPPTIGEFVDIISNNDHDFYFYQWNQTKILEKANYKYSIIKSEHMEEELLEKEILHNKGDLLNLNVFNITQKSKPYDQILDKKMIEKLRWWWEPDSLRFNYNI
jgi:hypothetical protein